MKEICIICDQSTGNAGIMDGSIHDVDGVGPYCEECFDKLPSELKDNEDSIEDSIVIMAEAGTLHDFSE